MDNLEDKNNLDNEDPIIDTPRENPAEDAEDPKVKRYKEQLKGRELQTKEAIDKASRFEEKLINKSVKEVEANNDYLLELYEEDPELAQKVAGKFGKNIDDAISIIKAARWEDVSLQKKAEPALDEEELFKKWEAKLELKNTLGKVSKQFETLPEDLRGEAQKKFDSLVGGRNLSASEITEIAEMASLYVQKDIFRSEAKDKAILGLSSTSLSRNNNSASSNTVAWAAELAEAMGLWHLYK